MTDSLCLLRSEKYVINPNLTLMTLLTMLTKSQAETGPASVPARGIAARLAHVHLPRKQPGGLRGAAATRSSLPSPLPGKNHLN